MTYPYPYDPYYPSLAPPVYRQRAHSHGRYGENTTNVFVPPAPDLRGREVERIADEIHALRVSQSRSRHRGYSDLSYRRSPSPSYSHLEHEIERLKKEMDHVEHKSNEEHHRKEIISQWENEQAEKKRKKEAEHKRIEEELRVEAIMKKEKEEKAYKEFEAKQAAKKLEEELKKQKEKEKGDEYARQKLLDAGLSQHYVDVVMKNAEAKKNKEAGLIESKTTNIVAYPGNGTANIVYPGHSHHHHGGHHGHHAAGDIILASAARPPTYPRASRDHISTEVLRRYGISYKSDPADSNYIIIYREMDQGLFEVLYDESREYRKKGKGKLLIEAKKDDRGRLSLVRPHKKSSRSRSRSRVHDEERILIIR